MGGCSAPGIVVGFGGGLGAGGWGDLVVVRVGD
jgi:hypothetical protein